MQRACVSLCSNQTNVKCSFNFYPFVSPEILSHGRVSTNSGNFYLHFFLLKCSISV